jgi:catechol 2,3-dioxygenase-like lactoylglutathione lyase family enzyme
MPVLPLAHISWALADNADRPAVDDFFIAIFGAQTAYEMVITPETEAMGFDREERLMMVGDTMLIPIAPAGAGAAVDSPMGTMLRRASGAGRWLGVSLRAADLAAADAWMQQRGFKLHYDAGMEAHYFLIARWQMMGMRVEIMTGELPNDPRLVAGWNARSWADEHPLGIEGLQAITLSCGDVTAARELFAARLEFPEIAARYLPEDDADCVAFDMGDVVIEAAVPRATKGNDTSALAAHLRDVQGIYALTFKVKSAAAAAAYLRGKGLDLIGDVAGRFAIAPAQAHGRLIYFTENDVAGYPPLGTKMTTPAVFAA